MLRSGYANGVGDPGFDSRGGTKNLPLLETPTIRLWNKKLLKRRHIKINCIAILDWESDNVFDTAFVSL
jgi:hypothetical protein